MTRVLAGVGALALALLLVGSANAAPDPATLEAELVCPTCKTTLDQSNAPVANRMKAIIRQRIAAGATAAEIKSELVEQFGPAVLAEPPRRGFDLLAWVLPLGLLALGGIGVAALAWAWRRRGDEPDEAEPLDHALERRLDDALADFDE